VGVMGKVKSYLKKGRQKVIDGTLMEIGVRPKEKVVKHFGRPPSKFLNTPL
jgi:hypothetical protein